MFGRNAEGDLPKEREMNWMNWEWCVCLSVAAVCSCILLCKFMTAIIESERMRLKADLEKIIKEGERKEEGE
jgi:hypothetical protein